MAIQWDALQRAIGTKADIMGESTRQRSDSWQQTMDRIAGMLEGQRQRKFAKGIKLAEFEHEKDIEYQRQRGEANKLEIQHNFALEQLREAEKLLGERGMREAETLAQVMQDPELAKAWKDKGLYEEYPILGLVEGWPLDAKLALLKDILRASSTTQGGEKADDWEKRMAWDAASRQEVMQLFQGPPDPVTGQRELDWKRIFEGDNLEKVRKAYESAYTRVSGDPQLALAYSYVYMSSLETMRPEAVTEKADAETDKTYTPGQYSQTGEADTGKPSSLEDFAYGDTPVFDPLIGARVTVGQGLQAGKVAKTYLEKVRGLMEVGNKFFGTQQPLATKPGISFVTRLEEPVWEDIMALRQAAMALGDTKAKSDLEKLQADIEKLGQNRRGLEELKTKLVTIADYLEQKRAQQAAREAQQEELGAAAPGYGPPR